MKTFGDWMCSLLVLVWSNWMLWLRWLRSNFYSHNSVCSYTLPYYETPPKESSNLELWILLPYNSVFAFGETVFVTSEISLTEKRVVYVITWILIICNNFKLFSQILININLFYPYKRTLSVRTSHFIDFIVDTQTSGTDNHYLNNSVLVFIVVYY